MGGNAICERIIGTLRRELLDRMLIVNENHLRKVLTEYLSHYNTARPHRALGQLTPAQADTWPPEPVNLAEHRIRRKQVLGGLTHEYYVGALPPPTLLRKSAGHHPESYFRAPQARPDVRTDLPPLGASQNRRCTTSVAAPRLAGHPGHGLTASPVPCQNSFMSADQQIFAARTLCGIR